MTFIVKAMLMAAKLNISSLLFQSRKGNKLSVVPEIAGSPVR